MSRSQALKKAWKIIRRREIESRAAGVTFGLRQTALMRLKRYNTADVEVNLVRENNVNDPYAVAVMVSVKGSRAFHIGYLPRPAASVMAWMVDKGLLRAKVDAVTGGNGLYGLNLRLQVA